MSDDKKLDGMHIFDPGIRADFDDYLAIPWIMVDCFGVEGGSFIGFIAAQKAILQESGKLNPDGSFLFDLDVPSRCLGITPAAAKFYQEKCEECGIITIHKREEGTSKCVISFNQDKLFLITKEVLSGRWTEH
jgi:hypothetical protein